MSITKTSARLVFFGTEDFSANSLEALINEGWLIQAVITKPDTKSGRGQKLTPPKVKAIAEMNGIKILQPEKLEDIKDDLLVIPPSHGILVAYGKIIPQKIIDLFPGGIINVHPSKLPRYRGPAPVEAAILNGDRQTAISLMKLTAGMDEGPVYVQREVELSGQEDRLSLNSRLSQLGAQLLCKKLPEIINGILIATAQDDSKATYTKLLAKEDGLTDWQEPAEILERKVRAYRGFPKLRGNVFGHDVIINKARVAQRPDDGSLVVKCNPGWLEVLELIAPSGRTMSGADFIRGYKP